MRKSEEEAWRSRGDMFQLSTSIGPITYSMEVDTTKIKGWPDLMPGIQKLLELHGYCFGEFDFKESLINSKEEYNRDSQA